MSLVFFTGVASQLMIFTEAALPQQFTQQQLLYIVANQSSCMCSIIQTFHVLYGAYRRSTLGSSLHVRNTYRGHISMIL